LSGDPNILQHWPNLIAYIESGCIGFFPPSSFGELKGFGQASLLIRWWPAIIDKDETVPTWRLLAHSDVMDARRYQISEA